MGRVKVLQLLGFFMDTVQFAFDLFTKGQRFVGGQDVPHFLPGLYFILLRQL